jgi:hypothetical protein
VVDDRRRESEQAADRRAQQRQPERDDAAVTDNRGDDSGLEAGSDEPGAVDDPADATGSGSSALDDPLGIAISTTTSADGEPALYIEHLGPVELGSASSIPYVASVLGEPDSITPNAEDANVCNASWVAWGLEARFYFGQPPSPAASCEKGPIAAALMTGERWFIQPLTGGGRVIGVGDPVSAIKPAFPDSRRERLTGGLETLAANTHGYLVVEGSYAGDPFPTLYAIAVDGSIASFLYVSGAD